MLTAETVHAESARYRASVLCLPGLWTGPAVWRGFAGYLGHRGWESHLLDVRDVAGGIQARARAVIEYAAALSGSVVLVAHDSGALLGLTVAADLKPAAAVLLAPVPPGGGAARRFAVAPRSILALLAGKSVPPPADSAAAWLDVVEPTRSAIRAAMAEENGAAVRDVVWGRLGAPAPDLPVLAVAGAEDRLVDRAAAETLARTAAAELRLVDGAGHWLLAGPRWQEVAALVHRWLVQQLGAPLLDFYAEAMTERESDEDPSE